jgi:glycosyltransferase involved in cell wall biosynthesis
VIEQSASLPTDTTANTRPDHAQSPEDVYRVLMVGNVRPEKDPLTALGALEDWAMERSRQERRRMQLVHCGASLDDSLYAAMRAYARALPEVFVFRGALSKSEVFEEMRNANMLLHPSVAEGGSLVIAEAVACDLPVLASDIGCHRAMLGSDYPGLFGAGDRGGLTEILSQAWADWALDSSDSVESMSTRCRRAYPGIRERLCDSSREREQLIGLLWPEGDMR